MRIDNKRASTFSIQEIKSMLKFRESMDGHKLTPGQATELKKTLYLKRKMRMWRV